MILAGNVLLPQWGRGPAHELLYGYPLAGVVLTVG